MVSQIAGDEMIIKLEKIELTSYRGEGDFVRRSDKCSGHCISDKPGLGHHDNREPLY